MIGRVFLFLGIVLPIAYSLKCVVGYAPIQVPVLFTGKGTPPDPYVYNATLTECPKSSKCCSYASFTFGNEFKCSSECGETGKLPECHPTKEELSRGFSGSSWCYCKDHTDPKCHNEWVTDNLINKKKPKM